jgi:catechol 2,3-dioxygenase-like lactoylglutathione lyase family enzyme
MTDRATPNLPSTDLDATAAFYERLGFEKGFMDEGWLILTRGPIELEFFPAAVDPQTTIASCCIRAADLDGLHLAFAAAGLPADCWSAPRLTQPVTQPWGMREFALVDPDGNLLRCMQS